MIIPDGTIYYQPPVSAWRLRIVLIGVGTVLAAGTILAIRLLGHRSVPVISSHQTVSVGQQPTQSTKQPPNTKQLSNSKTSTDTASSSKSNTMSSTSASKNSSSTTGSTSSSGNSGGSLGSSGGSSGSSGGTSPGEHIITTLYAYPTVSLWSNVESSSPTVQYAIVNICAPDGTGSGCGSPADESNPDWPPTIKALYGAGITPLYYISTNYGVVALSTLESEIHDAITWYGTPSPMFDTVSTASTCNNGNSPMSCTTYYNDLYTYAVNAGATTVMYNPGTIPPSSYMFGSKVIMQVFEGTAVSFETTSFPAWMSSYPANEFSATLSAGTNSTVGTDVTDAVHDGIGNIYEDDESEPPNYSTLPSFWVTEVNDVKSI